MTRQAPRSLRLYRHKDGALVTLVDYLHRRTRGMIGNLLWLSRDAACQVILDGTEKVTRKSLDQITLDMTAQTPPPRTGTAKHHPQRPCWASSRPGSALRPAGTTTAGSPATSCPGQMTPPPGWPS